MLKVSEQDMLASVVEAAVDHIGPQAADGREIEIAAYQAARGLSDIGLSVKRFAWMVLMVGLLVSGVNLQIAGKNPPFGILLMELTVVFFLWGIGKK